jgi:hypothetical protein
MMTRFRLGGTATGIGLGGAGVTFAGAGFGAGFTTTGAGFGGALAN